MSFVTRSRILNPSTFNLWTRSFATTTTAPPPPSSSTLASNDASTSSATIEQQIAPAKQSTPPPALPTTPPPTPYHAYVHLPLLSLTSTSPLVDSTTSDPLVVALPSPLFNTPSRPTLLHRLVVSHLASLRQGTSATKNRSQVNFSGKKTRPQKGTGRARLGSRGSPMLKGGGHAFAKQPKGPDGWSLKVNNKEQRLGLRVGLSDKWRSGKLHIVDRLAMADASTRQLNKYLSKRDWLDSCFIVANGQDRDVEQIAFELSSDNLPDVHVVSDIDQLGVWDIVKHNNVILELDAIDELIYKLDPELAQDLELLDIAEEDEFTVEDELTTSKDDTASSEQSSFTI
ncbi:54S ribosomal protein yml6, mitochondrial [Microbotryomycetes sp. JL221]|nr:54S ribosomal protein yml6, mitochondrial [Microbotryomycetes sp. JL221]